MTTVKKLWIGIAVLALLSPLGLIVPGLFGAGGAWGEWSTDHIREVLGYVPEGMKRLSETWSSPLSDYTVPGQNQGIAGESLGYIATAVIGIAVAGGIAFLVAKVLARKNRSE